MGVKETVKETVEDIKETVKDITKEKNINEPRPDLHRKDQSARIPPKPKVVVDEDGEVTVAGDPDGGVKNDGFLEKHRNDPPTH